MATSPHAASPVALAPGATLQNGRYRIGAVLGQGGFGITYRATHPLHDDVVLKELFLSSPPFVCVRAAGGAVQPQFDAGQFERFRERFLEEARQLARLRAVPGVVDVLDYFEENGTAYFTMPFVSETTLQALAPLPEARALRYIEQVGEALATLHQQNVLHRDVKPSNILITPEDRAVLIDFGAARQFVENEISSQTAMYSPGYGAPEQAVPSARRGPFTDVFALAGTLYYCLSGHRPPTSQERDLSGFRPLRERVPTASPAVDAALTRALQLNPEQRFPTVAAFLAALQPGDDDATRAVPPAPDERTRTAPIANEATQVHAPPVSESSDPPDPQTRVGTPAVRPRRLWPYAAAAGVLLFGAVGIWQGQRVAGTGPSAGAVREEQQGNTTTAAPVPLVQGSTPTLTNSAPASAQSTPDSWREGVQYHRAGQFDRAWPLLERAARAGETEAQYFVAGMLLRGEGVPKDLGLARDWFAQAADAGHAKAQTNLGIMIFNGMGGRANPAEALTWFERAARQNLPEAQYYLGVHLYDGDAGRHDQPGGLDWLRRAARQGQAEAQEVLRGAGQSW